MSCKKDDDIACLIVFSIVFILLFAWLSGCKAEVSVQGSQAIDGCYAAHAYPVNEQQARIHSDKGWYVMPYDDRQRIGRMVADKKAEWLLVPDHRVCGDDRKKYGTWYWREK